MNYTGKYFDGKSSAGHAADIQLNSFQIDIYYTDSAFQAHHVQWNTDKIHKNDFAEHDKVILKYGDFPFKYIEVSDRAFEHDLKKHYPLAPFHKSAYNWVFSKGAIGLVAMAVAFLGILALTYFYVVPWGAERFAMTLPVEWEQELGESVYGKMVSEESINETDTRLINDFFKQLHYKTDYNIQVVVVKDNVVNAYALPGGRIVVYEGILRKMDDYRELTALLSHEFSHVQLKHSTRNIARSLSSALLLSVLFGDASGITAIVIENADAIKQLGYSRQLEEDADRNGLELMKERKIDPNGMKKLFETLQKESGGEEDGYKFLSTHPLTKDRIKFVDKEISKKDFVWQPDAALDSLYKEIQNNLEE